MYEHTEQANFYLRRNRRREMSRERDSLALSNLLLCHESESSLNEEEGDEIKRSEEEQELVVTTTIGDDEFVAELVRKENQRIEDEPIKTTSSSSSFDRLIAIDWILTVRNTLNQTKPFFFFNFLLKILIFFFLMFFQTRTRFGFQHQTAYIAISYFDLFLKRRFIGVKFRFLIPPNFRLY